jgi:hypothetical protein
MPRGRQKFAAGSGAGVGGTALDQGKAAGGPRHGRCCRQAAMKPLALLALALSLVACSGPGSTALGVDGGGGVGGDGQGGTGGVVRGHGDSGFFDDDAGPGGGGSGGDGGSGGSGGTGGISMVDAAPPYDSAPDAVPKKDAGPGPDAGDICMTTCPALNQDYQVAVKADQQCSPGVAGQCAKQVPGSLMCGCPVWVNTTLATDSIRKRFMDAGCSRCIRACPAIACINPGTGVCGKTTAFVPAPPPPDGDARVIAPPPPLGQCMGQLNAQP